MNNYYKLLIYFKRGERITKKYLLGRPGISEELIYEAEKLGYIQEVDKTDLNEPRYRITEIGIQKRDN